MWEFSCHTWGFNDLRLPEALGTIARLGYRYVDIGSGAHLNLARAASPSTRVAVAREVLEDLKAFNLAVADVTVLLPRISVDDDSKRDADLKVFKAIVPFIKSLGAQGITVSAGLVHPPDDDAARQRTTDALKDMLASAQKFDMPLRLEPHLDSMAQTPAQALHYVREITGLGITLDWAHMVCQKAKPADINALLPYTRHVQLRQAAPNKLQTPHDKGKIDLADVIQTLKSVGYQGFICVELLQTPNWHGATQVSPITEALRLRDTLKHLRDAL